MLTIIKYIKSTITIIICFYKIVYTHDECKLTRLKVTFLRSLHQI